MPRHSSFSSLMKSKIFHTIGKSVGHNILFIRIIRAIVNTTGPYARAVVSFSCEIHFRIYSRVGEIVSTTSRIRTIRKFMALKGVIIWVNSCLISCAKTKDFAMDFSNPFSSKYYPTVISLEESGNGSATPAPVVVKNSYSSLYKYISIPSECGLIPQTDVNGIS